SWSFFFQAEDGIRDFHVTGVQTCALPIWSSRAPVLYRIFWPSRPQRTKSGWLAAHCRWRAPIQSGSITPHLFMGRMEKPPLDTRSEERRVGKEGRSGWSPHRYKNRQRRGE